MNVKYEDQFKHYPIPEAHENLILEVLRGRQSHFLSSDEIEAVWEVCSFRFALAVQSVSFINGRLHRSSLQSSNGSMARAGLNRSRLLIPTGLAALRKFWISSLNTIIGDPLTRRCECLSV